MDNTYTDFLMAVSQGNIERVRKMVNDGIDPSKHNNVALHIAVDMNYKPIVRYLVSLPEVDISTDDYYSIQVAIKSEDLELYDILASNSDAATDLLFERGSVHFVMRVLSTWHILSEDVSEWIDYSIEMNRPDVAYALQEEYKK